MKICVNEINVLYFLIVITDMPCFKGLRLNRLAIRNRISFVITDMPCFKGLRHQGLLRPIRAY